MSAAQLQCEDPESSISATDDDSREFVSSSMNAAQALLSSTRSFSGEVARPHRRHGHSVAVALILLGAAAVAIFVGVGRSRAQNQVVLEARATGQIQQKYAALNGDIRLLEHDLCFDVKQDGFVLQLWHCDVSFLSQMFSVIPDGKHINNPNVGRLMWTGTWARSKSKEPQCIGVSGKWVRGAGLVIVDCWKAPLFLISSETHRGLIRVLDMPFMCLSGLPSPSAGTKLDLWPCMDLARNQQFVLPGAPTYTGGRFHVGSKGNDKHWCLAGPNPKTWSKTYEGAWLNVRPCLELGTGFIFAVNERRGVVRWAHNSAYCLTVPTSIDRALNQELLLWHTPLQLRECNEGGHISQMFETPEVGSTSLLMLKVDPTQCVTWRPTGTTEVWLERCHTGFAEESQLFSPVAAPSSSVGRPLTWTNGLTNGYYIASPLSDKKKFVCANFIPVTHGGAPTVAICGTSDTATSQWVVKTAGGDGSKLTFQSWNDQQYYLGVNGDTVGFVFDPSKSNAQWSTEQVTSTSGGHGGDGAPVTYRLKSSGANGEARYLVISEDFDIILQALADGTKPDDSSVLAFTSTHKDDLATPSAVGLNPHLFPFSHHLDALEAKLAA